MCSPHTCTPNGWILHPPHTCLYQRSKSYSSSLHYTLPHCPCAIQPTAALQTLLKPSRPPTFNPHPRLIGASAGGNPAVMVRRGSLSPAWGRDGSIPSPNSCQRSLQRRATILPNHTFLVAHVDRANGHQRCEGAEIAPAAQGSPVPPRPAHGRWGNLFWKEVKTKPRSFLSSSTFLLQLLLPSIKCAFHVKGKQPIWLHLTAKGFLF